MECEQRSDDSASLRVVLLGPTGSGKSATGNSILGREAFKSDGSFDSVTESCKMEHTEDGQIAVIDTPGLSNTEKAKYDIITEIEKFSLPGPHAFLLVIRSDTRFTEVEKNAAKWIRENFGEEALKYTIVVFTHGELLQRKPMSPDLSILLKQCEDRYHALNNEVEDSKQVKELRKKIEDMVEKNGGKYYPIAQARRTIVIRRVVAIGATALGVGAAITAAMVFKVPKPVIAVLGLHQVMEKASKPTRERTFSVGAAIASTRTTGVTADETNIRTVQGTQESQTQTDNSIDNDSTSLKIVLLGPSSSGKTETGNCILGREAFPESPTTVCEAQSGNVQGRSICVIDTPGLTDSTEVKKEVQRCITLGPPAPTVFLFLFDLTNQTEWKKYLDLIEEIFDTDILMYVMVLFTRREQLTKESFDQLLNNEETQDLIKNCAGQYHCLDSKAEIQTNQVVKLLEKIDTIEKLNGVRIVLLGKTGSGKSDAGNTILGRAAFEEDLRFDSVTKICQARYGIVAGWYITLVDTPGLCDARRTAAELKSEIEKCVELSAPGPHVFLLVLKLGRFTEEESNAVKWIQENFGERVAQFTMVLFTHADQLKGKSLDSKLNTELHSLISGFKHEYHAINNTKRDNQTQVKELLGKIDNMVQMNGGEYYTNNMYQEAQKKIKEEQQKRQEEERKRKEYEVRIEELKREKTDVERTISEEKAKADEAERKLAQQNKQ